MDTSCSLIPSGVDEQTNLFWLLALTTLLGYDSLSLALGHCQLAPLLYVYKLSLASFMTDALVPRLSAQELSFKFTPFANAI